MVTKMADKIGLKERKCHFGPNLRLLETDFLRIARYQKILLTCCVSGNSDLVLKYLFGICLCSMLISLSNLSILLQNGQFPIFSLFWWPFLLP